MSKVYNTGENYLNEEENYVTHATPQEIILWSKIRQQQLGVKFRRQQSIGPFIADFYCAEKKLIIEIDGYQHEDNVKHDNKRTEFFNSLGLKVLRFWNSDINTNINGVIMKICSTWDKQTPPQPSLIKGEGE